VKRIKKIIALALTVFTILSCALPCAAEENDLELVAHRGFSSKAPENTLAAAAEAGKNGFFGCEFDIRLTKDDVWVVSHNNSLLGATDSARLVGTTTCEELQNIPITKGNGIETYPNERIPTLVEMLDECAKWGLHPVIEIKDGNSSAIAALSKLLDARPEKERFTIISFNILYLRAVKKNLPDMPCLYLSTVISDAAIELCLQNGIDGISFGCDVYCPEILERAREKGLVLSAWTVDDVEKAKELYAHEVKSITTNTLDASYADEITGGEAPEPSVSEKIIAYLKEIFHKRFGYSEMKSEKTASPV